MLDSPRTAGGGSEVDFLAPALRGRDLSDDIDCCGKGPLDWLAHAGRLEACDDSGR